MAVGMIKRRISRVAYAPVLVMAITIMFGRLLLLAKVLDVRSFAELSAALIVSSIVGMFASFGLFLELQRKLPGQLAKGHRRAASVQIALAFIGTAAIALLVFTAAGMQLSVGSVSPLAIGLGGLHGISQQLFMIVTTESRSNNEPMRFAKQSLLRATGMVLIAFPAAIATSSAWVVISVESLVTLGSTILISRKVWHRLDVSFLGSMQLGLRCVRSVSWKSLITLLLLSLAATFSGNIDRWLSSIILSSDEFAQYSFAWIVLIAASSIQYVINASVFPMIARIASFKGIKHAYRLTAISSVGMLFLFAIMIAPSIYIAELSIEKFYPEYTGAIEIIPFLSAAAALRISDFWSSFLIITGNEKISLLINIGATALSFGIWIGVSSFFADTQAMGIAYLSVTIALTAYTGLFFISYRYARLSKS